MDPSSVLDVVETNRFGSTVLQILSLFFHYQIFFQTTVQKWFVFFCWLWNKVRIPTPPEPWEN